MIIAFCSDNRGNTGTTSNVCCIAAYLAMRKDKRILLWENHFNWNMIGSTMQKNVKYQYLRKKELSYQIAPVKELFTQSVYYSDRGIDVYAQAKEIYREKLYYLENRLQNGQVFERELKKVLPAFLTQLHSCEGDVYIDVTDLSKESTRLILKEADLVVYNIFQDSRYLEQFFTRFNTEENEQSDFSWQSIYAKTCFLIGRYDKAAKETLKYIERKYQIKASRISAIPYNVDLKEAMTKGKLIDFLAVNMHCGVDDDNYYFMEQLQQVAKMIMGGGVHPVWENEKYCIG